MDADINAFLKGQTESREVTTVIYPEREIKRARDEEPKNGYVPLCTRIIKAKRLGNENLALNRLDDPGLSSLDRMILPRILMSGLDCPRTCCTEKCPGFREIPAGKILLPDYAGPYYAHCQRMIPKEFLSDGWESFSRAAMASWSKEEIFQAIIETTC